MSAALATTSACTTNVVQTGVADNEAQSTLLYLGRDAEHWNKLEQQLRRWKENPSEIQDDEVTPPDRDLIVTAIGILRLIRDNKGAPPLRIVPNGEGGIVFESRTGSYFQAIELARDRSVEFMVFRNSRLVFRLPAGSHQRG